MLVTDWRRVQPGTNGGISLIGTLAGLGGALVIAGVGWLLQVVPAAVVVPVGLLALLATILESVAGATLERSNLLDNDGVNLLNTLLAALAGAGLAVAMA